MWNGAGFCSESTHYIPIIYTPESNFLYMYSLYYCENVCNESRLFVPLTFFLMLRHCGHFIQANTVPSVPFTSLYCIFFPQSEYSFQKNPK